MISTSLKNYSPEYLTVKCGLMRAAKKTEKERNEGGKKYISTKSEKRKNKKKGRKTNKKTKKKTEIENRKAEKASTKEKRRRKEKYGLQKHWKS